MTRYFVGVAWPYANGPFHLGHLAGAYLPGDAFARFHRLRGDEVLMVSGSDMHGTPILVRAETEGTTPEAVARRFDEVNRRSFERLGFSFDRYTDTRTLVHERTVQELFLRLLERGFIARRSEPNAYCPKHARFLPDRYLIGTCPNCGFESARGDECEHCGRALAPGELQRPRCRLCGTPAEFRNSEHFYLELDKLQVPLETYVKIQTHWRSSVAKVAANFLSEGLHPTPITRDLSWGIPIPLEGYEGKRFYVWFDALIGYLSASKEWAIRAGRPEAWKRYWDPKEQVRHYYFIGKDNTFHHAVLWPGIALAHGELPLPYDVAANEWLVLGGAKLAKSGTPDLDASIPTLLERYPPDQIRFYAALLAPQNHDTEYDPAEFERVYEDVLANQFGNLAQRVLVLARDRSGGRVPSPADLESITAPGSFGAELALAHERITAAFERVELKEALELALSQVRLANRRFHEAKPWASSDAERERAVYEGIWLLEAASVWLAPFLPFSTAELRQMLGLEGAAAPGEWDRVVHPPTPGRPIGEVRPLFPKAEKPRPAAEVPPAPEAPSTGSAVPLDIRVGRIAEAAVHPSADRLLALKVDAGEGRLRSVVAGLRAYYAPEALVGRRIAWLANLAPRKIRGIESEGMVLAAEYGEKVALLVPPDGAAVGARISGPAIPPAPITFDQFGTVELRVGTFHPSGPGAGRIELGERAVDADASGPDGARVVVRLDPGDPQRGRVLEFGPGLLLSAESGIGPGARVR